MERSAHRAPLAWLIAVSLMLCGAGDPKAGGEQEHQVVTPIATPPVAPAPAPAGTVFGRKPNTLPLRPNTPDVPPPENPPPPEPAPGQPIPYGPSGSGASGTAAPAPQQRARPESAPDTYEPGQLVVLHGSMEEAIDFARQEAPAGYGVRSRQALGQIGLVLSVLRTPPGVSVADARDDLLQRWPDLVIDPNYRYGHARGKADPRVLGLIGWSAATPDCGSGIRIGVLDTLVDPGHPALVGARIEVHSVLPPGITPAPADHATAILALLVGRADGARLPGLLPAAEVAVAAAFRVRGDGSVDALADRLAVGLDWLLGEEVRVINLSFTGPTSEILARVLVALEERGVGLVAAAGNQGSAAPPAFPASLPAVVAVTAVDVEAGIYRRANRGSYVELAAPGVDLWLPGAGGERFLSGSSFAAPFATAALAARSLGSSISVAREELRAGAQDLGHPGRDEVFGFGLLQAGEPCAPTP